MSDTVPLTYRELGERLGLSPDSARIKAKRRKWQMIPGNHPSEPVRVLVPIEFLSGVRTPERKAGDRTPSAPLDNAGEINALREHVQTLREDLSRERTDHATERERWREDLTRERAGREADRQVLREQLEQLRADLAGRLDTAHRAHGDEAARLRQEIATLKTDLARPWWRRLIRR